MKVTLPPNKTEIGIVVSADEDNVVVATRHGYNITAKPKQLQRAFLLVLDLNGVLGARQRKTLFERRPHLERFLKFALTNFVVAVWTSCEERNGRQIVDDLFSDDRDRLLFCLYRGDCTPNPTPDRPFGTTKNLQRIFDRWPESFHAVNTVIVDDSADKCSHPDIALCPSQFSGLSEQPDDDGLLSTIAVLEKVLADDSLDPLIEAAAEHRKQLQEAEGRRQGSGVVCCVEAALSAVALTSLPNESATAVSAATMKSMEDKRILCCQHFSEDRVCRYGAQCKFAHTDDGRAACNRGTKCRRHSHRTRCSDAPLASQLTDLQLGSTRISVLPTTKAAQPPQAIGGVCNFNNLAATLLAKLNAAVSVDEMHAGGTLHFESVESSSLEGPPSSVRRASYVQETQSPMKHPPAQPHHRNFHHHQHQREKHHHNATTNGGATRNVVNILQNAQRMTTN